MNFARGAEKGNTTSAGPRRLKLAHPLPPPLPSGDYLGQITARADSRALRGPEQYDGETFKRQGRLAIYSVEIHRDPGASGHAIDDFRARHDGDWPVLKLFMRYASVSGHRDLVLPLGQSSPLLDLIELTGGLEGRDGLDLDSPLGWWVHVSVIRGPRHRNKAVASRLKTTYIEHVVDAYPTSDDIPENWPTYEEPQTNNLKLETVRTKREEIIEKSEVAAHVREQQNTHRGEPDTGREVIGAVDQPARSPRGIDPSTGQPFRSNVPRRVDRVDALFEEASRALTREPQ